MHCHDHRGLPVFDTFADTASSARRPDITLDLYGDYDEPKTSLSVVMTPDLAALESRAAELEAALRALVEAQPGCRAYRDHGSMLSGVTCGAVATVHGPGNSSKFCDEHKAEWMSELPQAQAVRAALLLLAKGG